MVCIRSLRRWLGHEGKAVTNRAGAFIKEILLSSLPLSARWGYSKPMTWKTDLRLPASTTVRKKFLFLMTLWHFIMVSSIQLLSLVWLLWPHGLQHTRPPCPSPNPRAYSNSCPSSWWCHPTISSSVVPFSSHVQSFPLILSFPVNQFFTSGSLSIGASASVLPVNIQSFQKNMISFGID